MANLDIPESCTFVLLLHPCVIRLSYAFHVLGVVLLKFVHFLPRLLDDVLSCFGEFQGPPRGHQKKVYQCAYRVNPFSCVRVGMERVHRREGKPIEMPLARLGRTLLMTSECSEFESGHLSPP